MQVANNVDTLTPRLGWGIGLNDSERNVSQIAYEVQAATSEALIESPDLWASGRVVSNASQWIPWAGLPLWDGAVVFWRVRVWLSSSPNAPSTWSNVSRFITGLQAWSSWTTQNFITLPPSVADSHATQWLRTTVTLSQQNISAIQAGNASALWFVAAAGYVSAYVNGELVSQGGLADARGSSGGQSLPQLAPSTSNLGRRVRSLLFDVSSSVASGDNVLGLWLAPGWTLFQGGNPAVSFNLTGPAVAAELRIVAHALNAPPTVVGSTDGAWLGRVSNTFHIGEWTNSNFGGDAVDHRLDMDDWNLQSANLTGWINASTVTLGRLVTPEFIAPTSPIDLVSAANISTCGVGCYVVTMKQLFTGWLSFTDVPAAPGTNVTLQYSTNAGVEMEFTMMDSVYVTGPGQSFVTRFAYHEIQYVRIRGLTAQPDLASIVGLRLMDMRARVGSFVCSDALLNAIYNASVDTYVGLSTGGMTVDCPHRERLGYGGDAHTSMEFAMATWTSNAYFRKWTTDWADVDGWNGIIGDLPHTAPTIDGGGGPGWGGFVVTMPWQLYMVSGDVRVLQTAYPVVQDFLTFLMSNVNASGLLVPFGGSWGFLGDWLTPHGSEQSGSPESILFNNCYLVYCLRIASRMAAVLGDSKGAAQYAQYATSVAAATHSAFFIAVNSSYLDTRQTHQVLPLIAGVVPDAGTAARVMATLVTEIVSTQSGHLDTGLHGTYFLFKLLTDPTVGRDDLIYLMTSQTTFPSYGQLLQLGYTTWPEQWGGAKSRMHGCLNGIGLWFTQGLLGVRADPAQPGMQHTIVRPAYGVGGLSSAAGSVGTVYGTILVSWQVQGNLTALNLTVPGNAAATVWLPAASAAQVWESGVPASQASGVAFLGQDGSDTVWQVASGAFRFLANASWV